MFSSAQPPTQPFRKGRDEQRWDAERQEGKNKKLGALGVDGSGFRVLVEQMMPLEGPTNGVWKPCFSLPSILF